MDILCSNIGFLPKDLKIQIGEGYGIHSREELTKGYIATSLGVDQHIGTYFEEVQKKKGRNLLNLCEGRGAQGKNQDGWDENSKEKRENLDPSGLHLREPQKGTYRTDKWLTGGEGSWKSFRVHGEERGQTFKVTRYTLAPSTSLFITLISSFSSPHLFSVRNC